MPEQWVVPCPNCPGKRTLGEGPHSPHWGKAPCGHHALLDCTNSPVKPCELCAQKPWPAPTLEHVALVEANGGISLRCTRCRSVLAFASGNVEQLLETFEEKHLFCKGDVHVER